MKSKYIIYLFVIYCITNVLMLFNNGVFWDDWIIFKMDKIGLTQGFGQNGLWIFIYINDFLNDSDYSPLIYHWLSFIFLFGTYAFFFKILKQNGCDEIIAFLIALLAMLAPYFETKNTMICMSYTMFLCMFSMGLYWVLGFLEKRNNYIHLILGSFFLLTSFFLNSLLPLFLFLLSLHFVFIKDFSLQKIKQTDYKTILTYVGLFLLPFIFWGVKKVFFPISGGYASSGYNEINIDWKELPMKYIDVFTDNIVGIYKELVNAFQNDLLFTLSIFLISVVFFIFLFKKVSFTINYNKSKRIKFFVFGFLLFLAAAFPYIVVNKLPSFSGYETRHQILFPVGLSFIVFPILFTFPKKLRKVIYIAVVSLFITINFNANANFLRGWIKMEAIKHDVAFLDENINGVIYTHGFEGIYNATEREFIFYELNGVFKEIQGKEDKFILTNERYYKHLPTYLERSAMFNMRNVVKKENEEVMLQIKWNDEANFKKAEIIKNALYYYVNRNKFKEKIGDMLSLTYKPKLLF